MINKKDPDIIGVSFPLSFPRNIIPNQDILNMDLNHQIISSNLTKTQKEFIIKTNKSFFKEFINLYTKNILLKAKLNEILDEKKNLSQKILKLEEERKKSIKLNKMRKDIIEDAIKLYRKSKRIRRKKSEITYVYKCDFPNCQKRYPSKGSLNMHIKLKHQKSSI